MATPRKLSLRRGRDMRVEVRGVERQHVGRELEAPDRRPCERNLCGFQLLVRHPLGDAIERLTCKLRGLQTRDTRQALLEELRQVSLRPGRAHPLECHRKYHLAYRRSAIGYVAYA